MGHPTKLGACLRNRSTVVQIVVGTDFATSKQATSVDDDFFEANVKDIKSRVNC